MTAPRRGRRLDSPEKRSHRSSKLRDTRHRRLTSGTFCLLPHPVPSTLSPRDKFLGRTAGECFLEKLHGHPPAPQKRRFPSSENQEVTSQQNYTALQQRRRWHPTPVLLPGKSHGRRNLAGCSPWDRYMKSMTFSANNCYTELGS